jgi:preprotein translocase subunit YajC
LSNYALILYVVAFFAIFYFMAIRPQQKQRRAHQALLASLKKGDSVVTASGIYGKVKRVEDNLVVLEVAKGVSMKMARRAVAEIITDSAQARAIAPEGLATTRGKRGQSAIEESVDDIESEGTDVADGTEQDSNESES